jgi:hypothetical protein
VNQSIPVSKHSVSFPHAGAAVRISPDVKGWPARFKVWIRSCAAAYQAAALYQTLAGLSDAELRRRGLARDTLSREVAQLCDISR